MCDFDGMLDCDGMRGGDRDCMSVGEYSLDSSFR